MAIKTKTMQVNLLVKGGAKKVPIEGTTKMMKEFIKQLVGNIYTYEIFLELVLANRAKRVEDPEGKAETMLTHAFFEFLNYLQCDQEVVFYNKRGTEIIIRHSPKNKTNE